MAKIPFSFVVEYRFMTYTVFRINQSLAIVEEFVLNLIMGYWTVGRQDGACVVLFVVADSETDFCWSMRNAADPPSSVATVRSTSWG
jgi:hypothetical protein